MKIPSLGTLLLAPLLQSLAQSPLPSSSPFRYPGIPNGPYSTEWQAYYEVKDVLPNVTWKMPRTYAGSVSVNRDSHANNTLFFIAYEKEDGSLAAAEGDRLKEPWHIWLNGGPGSSSLYGLFSEHGPIRFRGDNFSPNVEENPNSWHKFSDIFYIDQPVGTGYSTVDSDGYVDNEDQMGEDFVGFLTNIVAVFPSLKTRPLYISGESYAGTYIPYIAKTILGKSSPPVNLVKITIGNGVIGNDAAYGQYPLLDILYTYPQLIGFDSRVYEHFVEQYNLCGYNITLHYPESKHYPTLQGPSLELGNLSKISGMETLSRIIHLWNHEGSLDGTSLVRRQTPVESPPIPPLTGTIDPEYECYLVQKLAIWAVNYTSPWVESGLDIYRLSNDLYPRPQDDPVRFLNHEAVQAALHTPQKVWQLSIRYPFGNIRPPRPGSNASGDISPEPQVFISDIAKKIPIVFYSGNDDALVAHRGTELAIQNMTFGGIQGFTKRPSTPWKDDNGNFAGIVHQERGVTYVLFYGAGHMVPLNKPEAANVFLREFVFGSNQTGSIASDGSVVGGEETQYLNGVLTASEVFTGSYTTEGTTTWAAEKWSSWDSFLATRTAQNVPVASVVGDRIIPKRSAGRLRAEVGTGLMIGVLIWSLWMDLP